MEESEDGSASGDGLPGIGDLVIIGFDAVVLCTWSVSVALARRLLGRHHTPGLTGRPRVTASSDRFGELSDRPDSP